MASVPQPEPHIFVILGATGDLMRRKLLPALYVLFKQSSPQDASLILGCSLQPGFDDQSFRTWVRDALKPPAGDGFLDRFFYQPMGKAEAADYQGVDSRVTALEAQFHLPGNRAFYLALPPAAFAGAIVGLGQAGLNHSPGWTRLVIEKPFGRDLASAQELNRCVHQHFEESQIYRIDHYLGKETVQNLLVFRFANALFEKVWNRDHVESVEITVTESLGVEHRAAYYEGAGALRDMVQNHLTQLLTATATELPATFDAEAVRHEKVRVLGSVVPPGPQDLALGQYSRGRLDGQDVPGYREDPGVAPASVTETFVALKLQIDNPRWHGVPFFLCTGKRLPRPVSEIAVNFSHPPFPIFPEFKSGTINPNSLIITLQPDEGFDLHFAVKTPGQEVRLQNQKLHFRYSEAFGPLPNAYETLLLDVLLGDQTLFVRHDWVEASWKLYTPLLEQGPATLFYPAGTWGPTGLERFSWPPHNLASSTAGGSK